MFNSVVLDIVIGLVFIYLLYSLLASIVQEIIASTFSFRAKILEWAIIRMLEDENGPHSKHRTVIDLFKKSIKGNGPDSTSNIFYNHPLIKYLGENKRNSIPAYIDKTTFSKVLTDLLRGDQVKAGENISSYVKNSLETNTIQSDGKEHKINDETLKYLNSLWVDSQGDLEKFKGYLEVWFDITMERATGWYKKYNQFVLFFVGLLIAITFNVDTIKIIDKLEKDPKLREQLVQQADTYVKAHPYLDQEVKQHQIEFDKALKLNTIQLKDSTKKDSINQLRLKDSLSLAHYNNMKAIRDSLVEQASELVSNDITKAKSVLSLGWEKYECKICIGRCVLMSLLGWIITALALSLGAPFWFDLLNKLMKLRTSVTNTDQNKKQQDPEVSKIKRVG